MNTHTTPRDINKSGGTSAHAAVKTQVSMVTTGTLGGRQRAGDIIRVRAARRVSRRVRVRARVCRFTNCTRPVAVVRACCWVRVNRIHKHTHYTVSIGIHRTPTTPITHYHHHPDHHYHFTFTLHTRCYCLRRRHHHYPRRSWFPLPNRRRTT